MRCLDGGTLGCEDIGLLVAGSYQELLDASMERLEAFLEIFGKLLGRSWGSLGSLLGASWAAWRSPGTLLEASWRPFGASRESFGTSARLGGSFFGDLGGS